MKYRIPVDEIVFYDRLVDFESKDVGRNIYGLHPGHTFKLIHENDFSEFKIESRDPNYFSFICDKIGGGGYWDCFIIKGNN